MIKAVLFDLDDTLYDSSHSSERLRRAAVHAMIVAGLPAKSEEDAFETLLGVIKAAGSNSEHHFDLLCQKYGVKDPAPIIAAGVVAYHEMKVSMQAFPDVVPTLLQLIKNGYKLGIVTNGVPLKQWDKIIRLGIRDYFDVVHVAEVTDTSAKKSEPIKRALKELGIKPQEAVFVGDKLDADITSANRVGLHSVRILKGPHKDRRPAFDVERPSEEIHNLRELPKILLSLEYV